MFNVVAEQRHVSGDVPPITLMITLTATLLGKMADEHLLGAFFCTSASAPFNLR